MNTIIKTVTLGAAVSMLAACAHRVTEREVVREQPIIQQQPAPPERVTIVQPAAPERVTIVQPPPAPSEVMPAPPAMAGYSWVPGRYQWDGSRWEWQQGQWVAGTIRPMPPLPAQETPIAPAGTGNWVPGYWRFTGSDWAWVKGHWE